MHSFKFMSTILLLCASMLVTDAKKRPKGPPKVFGALLFPSYTQLDLFGPMETLNTLALRNPDMKLYLIAENATTYSNRPTMLPAALAEVEQKVLAEYTFKTVPKDLEVLIIPGGAGTRSPYLNSTIAYVKKAYPKLRYLITTCTGSTIAARAGVLDGKRATGNKAGWAFTTTSGPKVDWQPVARWVQDGNIWTTSGVSAGMDGFLDFIAQTWNETTADWAADFQEYTREKDPSNDPFAGKYNLTNWVNPNGNF